MKPANPHPLAIVIPAWRARYFTTALTSLRNQTDHRFRLYIGDDGSPDDLRTIADTVGQGLDIVYHRFPENLGGRDLIAHWERCLDLAGDEPWIWLFSDDDVADPGCVASFYEALENDDRRTTLFRFNTTIIDGDDRIIRHPAPHPEYEEASEMIVAIFTAWVQHSSRFWCAPDHIFSKTALQKLGGFINYPRALYSDLATWVALSDLGRARTIPHAKVNFRSYPESTSCGALSQHGRVHFEALMLFMKFSFDFIRQRTPQSLSTHRHVAYHFIFEALFRNSGLHAILFESNSIDLCHQAIGGPRWMIALRFYYYRFRLRMKSIPGIRHLAFWRLNRSRNALRLTGRGYDGLS